MFQIFAGIEGDKMQPHRQYENMGGDAEAEAMEAFEYECTVAQQAADYMRKPMSLELRNIDKGYLLAHKRFLPRDLIQ